MTGTLLANHLWQSTLCAGAAWLVTLALQRNRASVRHAVWLAASLKFLVPFAALVAAGSVFGWRVAPIATPPQMAMALDVVSQPFSSSSTDAVRAMAPAPHAAIGMSTVLLPLLAVWLLGVVVVLATWIVRWRRVSTVVRAGTPVRDGPVVDALRRIEAVTGTRRSLTLVESDASLEPGVFGLMAPVLFWPRPNDSGSGQIMMLPAANGGWQATNVTLGMLIRISNQLQDNQIAGGPSWLFNDRFDVKGTGAAPGREGALMSKVQSMLADRFQLVTHIEQRELPMYALVLARRDGALGEKLTRSTADCSPAAARGRGPQLPAPGQRPTCGFSIGPGSLTLGGQTMAAFATNLSRFVGGIVVDKTGLTGTFDIALTYAPDAGLAGRGDLPQRVGGAPPPPPGDAPSIFAALQEQLGLKLESTKGLVDVVVIDRAEKPTAD